MSEERQYPPLNCVLHFGDGEYNFKLTLEAIYSLQAATHEGLGFIYRSVLTGTFKIEHIVETVRFGLIGGGMSPKDASGLINTYGDHIPKSDWASLATTILVATMDGYNPELDGGEETGKKP